MKKIFLPWEEKLSISAIKLWETRKKCFSDYLKSLNSVVSEYQKRFNSECSLYGKNLYKRRISKKN